VGLDQGADECDGGKMRFESGGPRLGRCLAAMTTIKSCRFTV
jgi:hypothetical protein